MKKAIILIAISIATAGSALADVRIKTKQTSSGQSTESTTYIKGKRQRTEMGNGMLISIMQCDLGRDLQLAPQTKSYTISYHTDANGNPTVPVTQGASAPVTKGGIVNVTTTIRDTGERKQMFGYTARHIIQTVEMESSADACFPQKNKMEMDMWVIDAEFGLACAESYGGRNYNNGKNGGCRDRYVSKTLGTGKTGYPVYQKMTSFDPSGKEQFSMVQEVIELSKTTLDPSLFEIPVDFREVKDASMLYAAAPVSTISNSTNPGEIVPDVSGSNSSPGLNSSIKAAAQQPASNAIGPKKAGTVRVGVIAKTGAVGEGIAPADLVKAIENSFGQSVRGTKVEIIPIEARLPAAQSEEATQKECDYLMLATASHKKGGGAFGFGKMLGSVVSHTGIGHTGSTVGNMAGQMATTAIVAATLSNNVKAKDEVTLDITLSNGLSNAPALAKQFKAKAKGDGDDIITAVIEQAAQAIVDTIGK